MILIGLVKIFLRCLWSFLERMISDFVDLLGISNGFDFSVG